MLDNTDCHDDIPWANPELLQAAETYYDGIDADCDGASDYDADLDGYDLGDSPSDDCNDTDPAIHPGAIEVADNGIDEDCDGEDWITTGDTGDTGAFVDDTGEPDSKEAGCACTTTPVALSASNLLWFVALAFSSGVDETEVYNSVNHAPPSPSTPRRGL